MEVRDDEKAFESVRIRPKVGLKRRRLTAHHRASRVRIRPKVGLKPKQGEQTIVVAAASESDLR